MQVSTRASCGRCRECEAPNPLAGAVVTTPEEAGGSARSDRKGADGSSSIRRGLFVHADRRGALCRDLSAPVLQALIAKPPLNRRRRATSSAARAAECDHRRRDTIEHGFGLPRTAQYDGGEEARYDPTLVLYTEPYMDDNDKKATGGKYRMIPIFEKAVTMAAATPGIKVMVEAAVDGSTYPHGTQALDFEWLVSARRCRRTRDPFGHLDQRRVMDERPHRSVDKASSPI